MALRLNADDVKRVNAVAKANKLTVSEWMRGTLNDAIRKSQETN